MKILSLLFISFFISLVGKAQDYAVWQYSGKQLDFNYEPPRYLLNGEGASAFQASICDSSGTLAFYTSGYLDKPFNAYSYKNGSNETLLPTDSAFASSSYGLSRYRGIMIRVNDSIYYHLFSSSGTLYGKKPGVYFTLFNSNLNQGRGDIVPNQLNVRIYSEPTYGAIATKGQDGTWWFVCTEKDSLLAFKIDYSGINPMPVKSPKGTDLYHSEQYNDEKGHVYHTSDDFFEFSNKGDKFIRIRNIDEYYSLNRNFEQFFLVQHEFDKVSGKFSGHTLLYHEIDSSTAHFGDIRSIVYSPNDSFIYVRISFSHIPNLGEVGSPVLAQIQSYNSNRSTNFTSLILSTDEEFRNGYIGSGDMRLGMNSRIYISTGKYTDAMGMIYYPNRLGTACKHLLLPNFKNMDCDVGNNGNTNINCGDDRFPFTRYHNLKLDFDYRARCSDSALQLINLTDKQQFDSYRWYVYSTLQQNQLLDSSYDTEPIFSSIKPGTYYVKFRAFTPKGYGPWYSDTIVHLDPAYPQVSFTTNDTLACRFAQVQFLDQTDLVAIKPNTQATWQWKFSNGLDTTLNSPSSITTSFDQIGKASGKLIVNNGFCSDSFQMDPVITIIDAPKPGIIANPDKGCQELEVQIKRSHADTIINSSYDFGDGSAVQYISPINNTGSETSHTYINSGTYWLYQYLEGQTGCISKDSIPIQVLRGFNNNDKSDIILSSVNQDSSVIIEWVKNQYSISNHLERSTDNLNWLILDKQAESPWIDKEVNTNKEFYRYRISAYDTCGKKVNGLKGSTILLKSHNENNQYISLNWNPYETWLSGVNFYTLEYLDSLNNWISINQSLQNSYQDENFLSKGLKNRCYRVIATSSDSSQTKSYSNITCEAILPILWIPNAFTPNGDGHNDFFTIETYGIDEIEIIIYDRFGEQIFKLSGTSINWDGSFRDKACPEGIYAYQIKGRTASQKIINSEGTITLIK